MNVSLSLILKECLLSLAVSIDNSARQNTGPASQRASVAAACMTGADLQCQKALCVLGLGLSLHSEGESVSHAE